MPEIALASLNEPMHALGPNELRELMGFPVHFVTESPNCVHHSRPLPLNARLDGSKWVVPTDAVEVAHG